MMLNYVIVEGQSEAEFVNSVLAPYLQTKNITITPIVTRKNANNRGGVSKYVKVKDDINKLIHSKSTGIVTTFFDFFRLPTDFPKFDSCMALPIATDRVSCIEAAWAEDVDYRHFIPYIQKYEFEALLFSSNRGFDRYFPHKVANQTASIVNSFPNPEDINGGANTAPSKRIVSIIADYDKVLYGNTIALEVGIETMLEKCPRFRQWVEMLIAKINELQNA